MKKDCPPKIFQIFLAIVFSFIVAQFPGCAYWAEYQALKEPPEQTVILNISTDQTNVYPDEMIILKYDLLTRLDIQYEGFAREGNYKGFWLERFPPQENMATNVTAHGGRKYVHATIFKIALFAMAPDSYTIHPGIIKIFIRNFGYQFTRNMFRNGSSIEIHVKDFPTQGKPPNFTGSSGTYKIESNFKSKEPDENGCIYYEVAISGDGNIRQVKLPAIDFGPDLTVVNVKENVDLKWDQSLGRDSLQGKKTFQFMLHPNKMGLIKIPPVSFSYFDLNLSQYQTIITQASEISVEHLKPLLNLENKKTAQDLLTILLDTSGSMLARDFSPDNRMTATKSALGDFLKMQYRGLVQLKTFASKSSNVFGFFEDFQNRKNKLDLVSAPNLKDGTAIGAAIYEAALDIKDMSPKGRKIILLLTDGANNDGYIEPLDAAAIAKDHGITIYAIAIGTEELVPFLNQKGQFQNVEVKVDEESLKALTALTGGKTFRVKTTEELKTALNDVYSLISNN